MEDTNKEIPTIIDGVDGDQNLADQNLKNLVLKCNKSKNGEEATKMVSDYSEEELKTLCLTTGCEFGWNSVFPKRRAAERMFDLLEITSQNRSNLVEVVESTTEKHHAEISEKIKNRKEDDYLSIEGKA